MNAARTVVTAGSVRPNQSVSARTHTISKTSAEAPGEYTRSLLIAALVLLLAEWALFHRRVAA